jgi:CRISPR/Cas system-associated exonuclease Cas4 (RecB family)
MDHNARWDEGCFHASSIGQYLTCPRQYYFRHVLGLKSDDVAFAAITGSAYHAAISWWHLSRETEDMHVPDEHALLTSFESDVQRRVRQCIETGKTLNGYDDAAMAKVLGEAAHIFKGYVNDPRNNVDLLCNERRFKVGLGTGKTIYPFAGTVDQVRLVPAGGDKRHLHLVDIKSGKTKPQAVLLAIDYQLSVYALALFKGAWEENTDTETKWHKFNLRADSIAICFIRDYIPKQKNEFSEEIILKGEYEINPATNKKRQKRIPNPKFAEGYKKGDIGQVFYRTQRSEYELKQAEKDLGRVCAAIRFKMFFRRPVQQGACVGFCRFVEECSSERSDPL